MKRGVIAVLFVASASFSATHDEVQARVSRDVAAGKPIVAHVVVALADNANQGIVRVPAKLGNGQDARNNLYWGALYGVRTHLAKHGWEKLAAPKPEDARVLERVAFTTSIARASGEARLYVVADAWDGAHIEPAIRHFLELSAGRASESVRIQRDAHERELAAGGAAHVVAFIGHDGLMDFMVPTPASGSGEPRAAIVLACSSREYFTPHLEATGAHRLLLTTGLMAPEAYTLDAALRAWARGGASSEVREAAAQAYQRYQQCGLRGARGLFFSAP